MNGTHPSVVLERDARLVRVGRLDEDELVLPHLVQYALVARTQRACRVTSR